MADAYHTALSGGRLHQDFQAQSYRDGWGEAFVHDVARRGLPIEIMRADAIYGEPPWEHGYRTFNERAGVFDAPPWAPFMRTLGEEVRRFGKPTAMTAGIRAAKLFKPDTVVPIDLNGGKATICLWGMDLPPEVRTSEEVILHMASCFTTIGDPFCGYGRTGSLVRSAGGRFILSDYNAFCIGFISKEAHSWGPKG